YQPGDGGSRNRDGPLTATSRALECQPPPQRRFYTLLTPSCPRELRMSAAPAPLRLTLAEEFVSAAATAVPAAAPTRSLMRCQYCGGDLLRSRLRRYERAIQTVVPSRRPFRCQHCRRRRWRRWS